MAAISVVIQRLTWCMMLAMAAGVTLGQGWDLDDHVAVVGGDGDRVYLTTLDGTLDWAESLGQTWTLHSAPLLGGPMRLESLVPFRAPSWSALGHLQHVAMHPDRPVAVMAAVRDGADHLDLFLSYRSPDDSWSGPMPLDGLNTVDDEVFPGWLGADLVYASRVDGRFHLHRAAAATQWLRAERMTLEGMPHVHAVGMHEAGPNLRWVTVQQENDGPLKVLPWTGYNPSKSLATGWTLCLDAPACAGATLQIRTSTGALAAQSEGACLALDGLHMEDVWKVTLSGCLDNTATATAVLRDPEGAEVRRYGLSAASGWTFTMLPLDLLAGLLNRGAADGSDWPTSTSMWVHFDHAASDLNREALDALDGWAKALGDKAGPGTGRWQVTGHTDTSGNPATNKALSQERAEAVAAWLQTRIGVAPKSVEVRGMGSGVPCCEDDRLNRRVEVLWVPSLQ
ncbi:MAG: hypothetical protein CL822_05895 [Crocinitomicaceae bacterium]|nr:hypothetical protein [Crocinitomicaceae bacterium]